MKRGIYLFLIILLLNPTALAVNLNNSDELTEKDLIESCKFPSSGPELVLQKTVQGDILIWLYEPYKEEFGDLIRVTDFEKIDEIKYSFSLENNQQYTVEATIPDYCTRPKETTAKKENTQTKEVCGGPQTPRSIFMEGRGYVCLYDIPDTGIQPEQSILSIGILPQSCPPEHCVVIADAASNANPTPTDTGANNEEANSNINAQSQQALGNALNLFFDWIFKLLKQIWDAIGNIFNSIVNSIFPPQNIECKGRTLDEITELSIFTKESVTITDKSKASVSFEYDKCNDDKTKVEEVYCKKTRGNSKDEVREYKELPCSEGCNVDGGVCIPPPIELGDIKISGGIDNRAFSWVPFVGKLARARGSGDINAKVPLDEQKKCGYPEFSSNVKLWFHKDIYDRRYKDLIKEQKNDLFSTEEKKVLFPPKDGSYTVFIYGELKEGKLTLKTKYKIAKEDPPSDLNNFDMSGATENSFTKNLDDPEILKKFIELGLVKDSRELAFLKLKDAITAILKLYAGFSGMGLTTAQGIVMVKSGDPTYDGDMLPSDVTKKIVGLNNDNFDQEFESKIGTIIEETIKKKEYLEEIEKYCSN